MGILTNLLELSWKQEDRRRQDELAKWTELAQMPGIRPELRNAAIENIVGLAPPKAKGLKDVGAMIKGLFSKQTGDQAGEGPQQNLLQALASTGRPATSLPIPGGSQIPPQTTTMGGGPGGPMIGGQPVPAPPEISTTRPGVNMSEMLPPSQSQVGPVRPSAMLSPQEQLNMKLEEVGRTAEMQEQLRLQAEEGIQKIRDEAKAREDERQFQTDLKRADLLIAAGKTPEQAWSIVGRPIPRETVTGVTNRVDGSDPQLQAWGVAHGVPIDREKAYIVERQGTNIAQAFEAAPTKGTETPAGAPRDIEWARTVLADADAAKKTGRKGKYTDAQVQTAKDVLAKENRPNATQILINQGKYDPGTLQFMAQQYLIDRKPPNFGYGAAGGIQRAQFWNEVYKQSKAQGLTPQATVARAAAVKAAETSLTSIRRTYDAVVAFEATATANLDRAINQAQKTIDLGSIPLNHVFRGGARVFGSGPQAAADAARMVAYNEVAKVLTSPSSNAALTEGARAEGNQVLNGDYTIPQLKDVAALLKQDMATRKMSLRDQMNQIRTDIMGGGTPGEEPTPTPGTPPPPATPGKKPKTAEEFMQANQ